MSCQIQGGKYFAPNGKESILYKDLEKQVGAEKAKELFVTSYTKTFQDKVIQPLINSYKERVKNLLPLREDVTFKQTEVNGIKTTHIYGEVGVGNMKAPNGKPSNLSESQYMLVRTPEFKTWFGIALEEIESQISRYRTEYAAQEDQTELIIRDE